MTGPAIRTWITGPMTGLPRWNFSAFDEAELKLVACGLQPVSPAQIDRALGFDEDGSALPEWFTLEDALIRDLQAMCTCEAILYLSGWERYVGCQIEDAFARLRGLSVVTLTTGVHKHYAQVRPRPRHAPRESEGQE